MQPKKYVAVLRTFLAQHPSWYWLGLLGLFIGAAIFRFWGLGRFNELVFDENHFAKFANYYLTETAFLDGHPPLGKYFIALGIWLSQFTPFGYGARTVVAEFNLDLPTVSYRWMNALVGSCIPVLVAVLAYQLFRRYRISLIAGLFTALDGLLLVESRYALINVYLLVFGLLGQIFFLTALSQSSKPLRMRWLLATGLGFGAAMSVKWTGLGFLLGPYILWGMVQAMNSLSHQKRVEPQVTSVSAPASLPYIKPVNLVSEADQAPAAPPSVLVSQPLRQLGRLHWRDLLFYLGILPVFLYFLIWLPHIHHDPQHSLLGYQRQLYTWHTSIGGQDHPNCSAWYTWPLLIRSVAFYYNRVELPATFGAEDSSFIYRYVNGMGNPFLWWQSSLAILVIAGVVLWSRSKIFARSVPNQESQAFNTLAWTVGGSALYILLSYLANLLPWGAISRCSLIYHYMPASLFSFLALAWVVDQGLDSKEAWKQAISGLGICLVIFGFFYWLPFFLGLPVTTDGHDGRLWLKSWL